MKIRLILIILFVCLLVVIGVHNLKSAQEALNSTSQESLISTIWQQIGPTFVHLLQIFIAVAIFGFALGLVLGPKLREAIENSVQLVFTKPLDDALAKFKKMSDAIIITAEEHRDYVKTQKSRQLIPTSIPVSSENGVKVKLAETLREDGRIKEAIQEYENLISNGSKNAEILCNLGICYSLNEDFEKSIQVLEEALKLSPNDSRISHNLGSVLYKRKEYEKSLLVLEKSVQNGAENYQTRIYLGLVLWKLNRSREAIKATEPVLEKAKIEDQNDVHWLALAHNNIAYYLFQIADDEGLAEKKDLERAKKCAHIALELEPKSQKFMDTVGCIKLWEGKYQEAYDLFARSLKIEPRPLAAEHLSRAAKLLQIT